MIKKIIPMTCLAMIIGGQMPSVYGEDLIEIYKLAQDEDPSIKAAEEDRNAAEELRPQARANFMPVIGFSLDQTKTSQDVTTDISANGLVSSPSTSNDFSATTMTLSAQQPLLHYENHIAFNQVKHRLSQADANLTVAKLDLMVRTVRSYVNILTAMNNLEFSKVEKNATYKHLQQTRKRYKVGLIASTNVSEAQARYDLARADVIASENQVSNQLESLREITNAYHDHLNVLKKNVKLVSPTPANIDEWAELALENSPNIVAAKDATTVAKQQIKLERTGHFPTIDLIASYTTADSDQDLANTPTNTLGGGGKVNNTSTDALAFSFQVNVPIFQGMRVTSKMREASYAYNKTLKDLDKQRRTVISQTRQAYLGVIASISRAKALKQAVVSSRKAQEAVQAGFKVGTRTIVDVLNAQRDYHRSERDLLNENFNYIISLVTLKQAAGTLEISDIEAINQWLVAKK